MLGGNESMANLRIRKLTPNECARLQAVKQADFERMAIGQSDSSLYHLIGDSISCNVLCMIYGKLLCVDYDKAINEIIEDVKRT